MNVPTNNEMIINLQNYWIKYALEKAKDYTDMNSSFNCNPVMLVIHLFKLADIKNLSIEDLLPPKTRRGNTETKGRVSTFYSDCIDELKKRHGNSVAQKYTPIDPNKTTFMRYIDTRYSEEFILIVKRKLGLM